VLGVSITIWFFSVVGGVLLILLIVWQLYRCTRGPCRHISHWMRRMASQTSALSLIPKLKLYIAFSQVSSLCLPYRIISSQSIALPPTASQIRLK